MAKCIISACRRLPELKGSLLLTAIEMAHRANARSGVTFMSYSYIASKTHQSRRTAIRHIKRLGDLGILRVQRFWGPKNCWRINRYQFAIAWEKPQAYPPAQGGSDTMTPKLPVRQEEEKYGTLHSVENIKKKASDWLTTGSAAWNAVQNAKL